MSLTLRIYFSLTKPGILMGNALSAFGGFMLATRGSLRGWLFLAMLLGLLCIIASACVCNNYIDREMDALMTRTKNRALARQLISPKRALLFALCLGLAGTFLLAVFCNLLTMCVALFGFLVYVLLYSYFKYHSMHATLVGSLAGAVPPVVGYCAVSNRLDAAAALLFLLLVLWQMPHFYAIAIYRLEDYTAARIPVLPIQKGIEKARVHMFLYVAAFLVLSCTLPLFHRVGWGYLCTMSLLAITWLGICLCGFFARNHKSWARTMFRFSLLVIVGFCAALACCS